MIRIKPVNFSNIPYSPASFGQHLQTAKNSWDRKIFPNGDIEITIHGNSKMIPSEKVISMITKNCPKNNRFAEITIEGRMNRIILNTTTNPTDKTYYLCALYAALRSSGAYDSPYGGGRNSIFNIPVYLGCSHSKNHN